MFSCRDKSQPKFVGASSSLQEVETKRRWRYVAEHVPDGV